MLKLPASRMRVIMSERCVLSHKLGIFARLSLAGNYQGVLRLGKELGKQLFSESRVASSNSSTKSWTAISLDSPVNASLTTRDPSLGSEDLNSRNVPSEDMGKLV